MKNVFSTLCAIAIAMLVPSVAKSQNCNPACSQGQSCCVMQYSNGTYSAPYCKTGSCYTAMYKKSLKNAKEFDSMVLKETKSTTSKSVDCNPACGQGQSCCVMQYSNGTYSAPYCKTGSCYTTANKTPLKDAKEVDATVNDKK